MRREIEDYVTQASLTHEHTHANTFHESEGKTPAKPQKISFARQAGLITGKHAVERSYTRSNRGVLWTNRFLRPVTKTSPASASKRFHYQSWLMFTAGKYPLNGLVQPLEALENKLVYFLGRFPEYKKTLRLAVLHEESGRESHNYQGWQWHDVEIHPTKLIRLVTEGISRINLRTRQATSYLLRDREAVKRALTKA